MRLSLLVMVTLSWMPLASGNIQEIDPPEILAPEDNAIIYGPQLTVRWAPLEEGQWCQIQIARDPDFNEILADADELHGDSWNYALLPRDGKRYYWRICAWQKTEEAVEGEEAFHPADKNKNHHLEDEETREYRIGWQTGCFTMRHALRALFIQNKGGNYFYKPGPQPPLCWSPVEE
ncbi:MAG: hypothetical protein GX130_08865 [Candidatus Hydrogenedens sp.]|nr:hypothetical protein [Candidatus Hydrogenedens sp.]